MARDLAAWRDIRLLSAASLISDVSGEMLQSVLPFLLVAQGATGLGLGIVGGGSEAVGHFFKLVGGYWGERSSRKKAIVAGGYGLASASRFGVALATAWPVSLAFRSLDRVGKGLRTAPRDAMLADVVPRNARGRAFGLHRAADTAGAVIGIVIALVALASFQSTDPKVQSSLESKIVLAGAVIGLTSVIPILFVRRPRDAVQDGASPLEPLSPRYGGYLVVSGLFYLGHVSYLFFILRAAALRWGGLPTAAGAVLLYLVFNLVYMAAAYPAGQLTDRFGRIRVLAFGYALAAGSFALFALQPSGWSIAAGFVVLGFSFAATEGTGRALAADLAGSSGRSHRLGWFHFTTGVATILGGLAAGLLWDAYGPWAAFAWGAGVSGLAFVALVAWAGFKEPPQRDHPEDASPNGVAG
ncbi:MAG: MFS transporter [bacterium]